jgi:hypothetical protein
MDGHVWSTRLRLGGLAVLLMATAAACGSTASDEGSSTTASSVVTTVTSVQPSTTTSAPTGSRPTCAEVDAFLAQLSPSDRAMLARADFMYVGRGPTGGDTWRIYTQVDVTQPVLKPEIAVYYDWSPESGLSAPTVITSFEEREALVDLDTVQVVAGMTCQA